MSSALSNFTNISMSSDIQHLSYSSYVAANSAQVSIILLTLLHELKQFLYLGVVFATNVALDDAVSLPMSPIQVGSVCSSLC